MATIQTLTTNVVADTTDFTAKLTAAGKKLDAVGSSMTKSLATIDSRFSGLGEVVEKFGGELFSIQGALGTFIGAGTLTGLIELTKESLDAVGGLGELADQVGVSTDTLQALQYAATQTGLSSDDLQAGLAKLSKTIGDAEAGSKTAIDAFDKLGVKILDAGGNVRSTDDIILDIADGLQKVQDPGSRAADVVDLFGKAGQKLLPFLQDGAPAVQEFVEQAKNLGLVFDGSVIAAADKASDKISEMELRFDKFGQTLAGWLAGPFNDFADWTESIGRAEDAQTASVAAHAKHLQDVSDAYSEIVALQAQISQESATIDSDKKLGLYFDDLAKDVSTLNDALAVAKQRLAQISGAGGTPRNAQIFPVNFAPPVPAGASNPAPSASGKSLIDQNSDKIKSKIDDLSFALDQLGQPDLQQKINANLKGIDLTMPGAAEGAATIAELTKEQQNNEIATEGMTAAKEADQLADQQWQQELQRGQQVHDSVRTATEQYNDTLANLNDLLGDGAIGWEDYQRAVADAQQKLNDANPIIKEIKDDAQDLGQAIGTAFEDAVLQGQNLRSVLQGLLQDVARLLLRIGEKQLESGFGGVLGDILGVGASAIGTSAPSGANLVTGMLGHAAQGGYIQVGERGPELFRPSVSGSIIPNDAIGNTNNVTLNAPITVNAAGGTPAQNKDLADQLGRQIVPKLRQMVQGELQTQLRDGGMIKNAIGR